MHDSPGAAALTRARCDDHRAGVRNPGRRRGAESFLTVFPRRLRLRLDWARLLLRVSLVDVLERDEHLRRGHRRVLHLRPRG